MANTTVHPARRLLIQLPRRTLASELAKGDTELPHIRKTKKPPELPRLGHLAPQYKFFLNPYTDARFTSCPGCGRTTKLRKLPLAIHVDQWGMVLMNKECRFCPHCDLLIAHRDEMEPCLAQLFSNIAPEAIGNDYLVIGTVERPHWRRGLTTPLTNQEMLAALHDFQDVLRFEPEPRRVLPDRLSVRPTK